MALDDVLQARLAERRAQSRYRSRRSVGSSQGPRLQVGQQSFRNFCSNDYLGLANHPKVKEALASAARQWGAGSGASHLVCGHSEVHHALEEALAALTQRPRALLFSTGYMANLGAVNALVGRGDAVFEDRLNHASLLDAGLLSQAKFHRYRHNDPEHLAEQLAASEARHQLIVTDGVFSMDGDIAPLAELAALAQKHGAWLMVDDAHGVGCLGASGGGVLEQLGLGLEDVPVLVGTLGKAFGTFGAFVAGSEALIESLIQFARTYIYTTAMPPAVAAATLASLQVMRDEPWRRDRLQQLIVHLRRAAADAGVALMPSNTAIQPVVVGSDQDALAAANFLSERGFWVSAIRPPTVPKGSARLRITLSAEHSVKEVESLVQALADCPRLPKGEPC